MNRRTLLKTVGAGSIVGGAFGATGIASAAESSPSLYNTRDLGTGYDSTDYSGARVWVYADNNSGIYARDTAIQTQIDNIEAVCQDLINTGFGPSGVEIRVYDAEYSLSSWSKSECDDYLKNYHDYSHEAPGPKIFLQNQVSSSEYGGEAFAANTEEMFWAMPEDTYPAPSDDSTYYSDANEVALVEIDGYQSNRVSAHELGHFLVRADNDAWDPSGDAPAACLADQSVEGPDHTLGDKIDLSGEYHYTLMAYDSTHVENTGSCGDCASSWYSDYPTSAEPSPCAREAWDVTHDWFVNNK